MTLRIFLLIVMALFALRAAARLVRAISAAARPDAGSAGMRPRRPPVKMEQDPVCGTFVVPGKALSTTADGATLWFCSEHCRREFARRS